MADVEQNVNPAKTENGEVQCALRRSTRIRREHVRFNL